MEMSARITPNHFLPPGKMNKMEVLAVLNTIVGQVSNLSADPEAYFLMTDWKFALRM
jgi:hypothetical protein